MSLHCITCGRLILRAPAVTVERNGYPLHMGRTCAIRAGLLKPKRRVITGSRRFRSGSKPAPLQLDFFEQGTTA